SIFSLCIFYASPPPYISTLSLHDALPILEKYRIGSEIAASLGEIDIMPAFLSQTLVRLRAEDVERQQRAAAREEQRRREEEAARQAAQQAELHRKMTPMERYEAGMMLPNIKDAIAVVSL